MSDLTLAEFLLARLAEHEKFFATYGVEEEHRAWLLADVEAKRRIVEWHRDAEECCDARYGPIELDAVSEWSAGVDSFGNLVMSQSIGSQRWIGCVTLMLLALPYADHPDYREEWRP